ncbi:Ww domain, partial [Globisporangium splendens]
MTLSAPSLPHGDSFSQSLSHLHPRGSYLGRRSSSSIHAQIQFEQQQYENAHVLRVSHEVENIGARVPMSKKRISWRFVLAGSEQVHTVTLEHSRITAKKRLRLDGRRLFNSEHYCAGDWKYEFKVGKEEPTPLFTVVIKDVKATVVEQHSVAGIYELYADGFPWEQLPERVFAANMKRKISNPVWSSDKFARRVTDSVFDLQHNNQQPGQGHSWCFAFGVLGTIHQLELWDLEQGEFVVVLDCRELARVNHDDIEEDTWEYEYTLASQHELVLAVTLEDDGKKFEFFIDGSPWKDISETDFVLQPGWFPVYSRSKGSAYFRNHTTGETQWEKPIMSRNGSIIEQIPSQDLKPTVSPTEHHEKMVNVFDSNALEFQAPVPLPVQEEVNLLDFSEISVHSSPKAQAANYAFDPFDPIFHASAAPQVARRQSPMPSQQYPQQPRQQHQLPIDLLS